MSLPMGSASYNLTGILVARIRGRGSFYSVPFGGYSVSNDAATLMSLLTWVAVVFVVLVCVYRPPR